MNDTERLKAMKDAVIHGTGYLVDGKHVDFETVTLIDYAGNDATSDEEAIDIIKKYIDGAA